MLRENEIVETYMNGNEISTYLGTRNYICPILDNDDIRFLAKLGQGANGIAYLISFKNKPAKKYVLKKSQEDLIKVDKEKFFKKSGEIDDATLMMLNDNDIDKKELLVDKIVFTCKLKRGRRYNSNVDNTEQILPIGSISCFESDYSEFLIASILGQVRLRKECINFLEMFDFNTCIEKNRVKKYTFMEVGGKDMYAYLDAGYNADQFDPILLQIMFAMELYQRQKISHNDLHMGNILLTETKNENTWSDEGYTLDYYSHFEYIIDGISIYVPNTGYIAKIVDFGYATRFETPYIVNRDTLLDDRRITPNVFNPEYDFLFILYQYYTHVSGQVIAEDMLREYCQSDPMVESKAEFDLFLRTRFDYTTRRPILYFLNHKNSWFTPGDRLLNSKYLQKYRIAPLTPTILVGKI